MTPTFDELPVGTVHPPRTDPPLTITDFVRYQGASGDMNPIHHDAGFAQAAGYPGPFAVGMLQAGRLATYVTDWLGPGNVRRFSVRFRELAWPGDALTYAGRVVARDETERSVEVELACTRPDGTPHLTGAATFVVPES
jgi:acyl dehydratase